MMVSNKTFFSIQIISTLVSILTKLLGVLIIRYVSIEDYGLYSSVNAVCVLIAILWLFSDKANLVFNINSTVSLRKKVLLYKKYLSIFLVYNLPVSLIICVLIINFTESFPIIMIVVLSIRLIFIELIQVLASIVEVTVSIKRKIIMISLWGLIDILSLLMSYLYTGDIISASILSVIISILSFLIYTTIFVFNKRSWCLLRMIIRDLKPIYISRGFFKSRFDIFMSIDKRLRAFYKNVPAYLVMYHYSEVEVAYLKVFQNYSQLVFIFTSTLSLFSNHLLPKTGFKDAAKKITLYGLVIALCSAIIVWLVAPFFFAIVFPGKYQELVQYMWMVVFISIDIITVTFSDQYRKQGKVDLSIIQGILNLLITVIIIEAIISNLSFDSWLIGPIIIVCQMYIAYPIHYYMLRYKVAREL